MPTNEYIKEWRKTPTGKAALVRQKGRDKARRKAIEAIIKAQPSVWETIYNACLRHQEEQDGVPRDTYGKARQ